MNPWSRYIQSLIHVPGPDEPPRRSSIVFRRRAYERFVVGADSTAGSSCPCDACGAAAGTLHIGYCNHEKCPVCGGTLVACGCFPEFIPPWHRPILIH